MRRKQCEITERDEMEAILARVRVGRLATVGEDGYPYITPVNFVYWRGSVYFHCAHEGEKIANIRRDDRVCFEVDIPLAYLGVGYDPARPTCHVHQFYHCVLIRGRAELVEETGEKVAALNALMAAHEEGGPFRELTSETREVAFCSVVAVRIERLSGKSDLAQKMAAEEKARVADYLRRRGLAGDLEAARLIGGRTNG